MTTDFVNDYLALGEGQRIEFKSVIRNIAELGKVACGFLNTAGGYIICGVDDRGIVSWIDTSLEAIAKLERQLHEAISPKALILVQVQVLEQKPVIVIEVPAGKDVPYAYRDVIYIRIGEMTKKADAETIRDIVMRHQIEPERWERRFSFADIEKDVDFGEVQATVSDALKVRRAFFRDMMKPSMVLEDLAVALYGRLTNAGDVLFSANPSIRLPQIRVRATRYNSDKAGDTFSDMKSFEGPLHKVFEEAYSFIVRNTPTVSRFIKGNPKRQDSPLYPEEVIREALINALAHRDYSDSSGGVANHVFPHRLEIWNSGPLPEGITAESLTKGHISVPRNPDIAHVLYLRGYMEKAGRGSVLMIRQCSENGLPAPVWHSDRALGVTVTFRAPEVKRLLQCLKGEMTRQTLQDTMGLKDAEHFRKSYLLPALELGVVEMTIPDKPKSSKQQYRLTQMGIQEGKR
jgi:ATP-dependent DNA helicase RecG